MGDMADYYLEQDLTFGEGFYSEPEAEFVWVAKDGARYRPEEMTNRHLTNSIRMLRRRIETAEFVIAIFTDELKDRNQ